MNDQEEWERALIAARIAEAHGFTETARAFATIADLAKERVMQNISALQNKARPDPIPKVHHEEARPIRLTPR